MVLYVIGLGLYDANDMTVRGLEAAKGCKAVFLERYTSVLGVDHSALEEAIGQPITVAYRETFESDDLAEGMYGGAKDADVALLVVGDPLCATTHADIILRARKVGIEVQVVHNASVMGAVASTGLSLYVTCDCAAAAAAATTTSTSLAPATLFPLLLLLPYYYYYYTN